VGREIERKLSKI